MKLTNKQRVELIDTLRGMAVDGAIDLSLDDIAKDVAPKIGAERLSAGVLKRQLEALDLKWKSGYVPVVAQLFRRVEDLERRMRRMELERATVGHQ